MKYKPLYDSFLFTLYTFTRLTYAFPMVYTLENKVKMYSHINSMNIIHVY